MGLTRFAYVVDSDNNGNPNDGGATWTAGETFTDSANSVSVEVTGSTTNGYTVRIGNGGSTAPANDNLANAQGLVGSNDTEIGTNQGASKENGEPNHANNAGGKSVWHQWTPSSSGTAALDTIGSNFDTLLGVYTGSAVNSLNQVVSNDDDPAGGTQSKVSFQVNAGTTYRIAVDGYDAAAGSIKLNLASSSTGGDTTAPSVSLTAPGAGAIVRGAEVELSANATDNVGVARVQFLVGGNVVGTDNTAPYSLAWNSKTVPDGQKTVTARAFDAASNSTTSAGRQLIVDNWYPDTVIDSGPPTKTKSTKATFRFSSPDGDVIGFQCKLDGKAWVGCGSPKTYSGLSRKRHTFQVRAIGSARVVLDKDPTPAMRTWTVRRR